MNADRRLCTPKRLYPALSSRRPISRSGARDAKTSSYRANNFRQVPADFNPSERVNLRYPRLARFGYSQMSGIRRSTKPVSYWTVRRGRPLVISLRFDTNHKSLLTNHATSPLPLSLLTSLSDIVRPPPDDVGSRPR